MLQFRGLCCHSCFGSSSASNISHHDLLAIMAYYLLCVITYCVSRHSCFCSSWMFPIRRFVLFDFLVPRLLEYCLLSHPKILFSHAPSLKKKLCRKQQNVFRIGDGQYRCLTRTTKWLCSPLLGIVVCIVLPIINSLLRSAVSVARQHANDGDRTPDGRVCQTRQRQGNLL